jgi:hypothetical protein
MQSGEDLVNKNKAGGGLTTEEASSVNKDKSAAWAAEHMQKYTKV